MRSRQAYVQLFNGNKVQPNTRTFNTIMKGFDQLMDGGFSLCLDFLTAMRLCGIAPDAITFNTIVHIGTSSGDFKTSEEASNLCDSSHLSDINIFFLSCLFLDSSGLLRAHSNNFSIFLYAYFLFTNS